MSTSYANAVIKAPVLDTLNPYVVTSPFGPRTLNIGGKIDTSVHTGVDLVPVVKVKAIAKGKVIAMRNTVREVDTPTIIKNATVSLYAGNYIEIQHGNGEISKYGHLAYGSILVKVGDIVEKGQVIATVGKTGYVTGAHLHFAIKIAGKYVDPMPYLLGKATIKDLITNPKMYPLETPTLTILASVLNYRDAPNGKVVGQLPKGAMLQCTRKSEMLEGYQWAEVLFEDKWVYCALNPLWNTLTEMKVIEKTITKEVYKPLSKVFEDAEVKVNLIVAPK